MKTTAFCYWIQGLFELGEPKQLDERQTALIRSHLALVFKHHIDPSAGPPEHQAELDAIHAGADPMPAPFGGPGPGGTMFRC